MESIIEKKLNGEVIVVSFSVKVTKKNKPLVKKLLLADPVGSPTRRISVGDTATIDYNLQILEGTNLKHFIPILFLANSEDRISDIKLSGTLG